MTRNRLYSLLTIACFIGFIYLFYTIKASNAATFSVCIFKSATGFACPSCGTTRALSLLLMGEFLKSIFYNPFGLLVGFIMTVCPAWIVLDVLRKKDTLYQFYKKSETVLRKPKIALPLLLLVLLNWIWNLYKHL
jgi:hypothetical protein